MLRKQYGYIDEHTIMVSKYKDCQAAVQEGSDEASFQARGKLLIA